MKTNSDSPAAACADRLKDLKELAETGEASPDFVAHAATCPACLAAVQESFDQRRKTFDKMESVVDDIRAKAPPSRTEVICGYVCVTGLAAIFLGFCLFTAMSVCKRQGDSRDYRLGRETRTRVVTAVPEPVGRCYADHRMLCEMTGDQDACAAEKWYGWLGLPAPTKVVCLVDAYYTYHHPDRPAFYVVEGDEAIGYRICGGSSPSDCPPPAKELVRLRLPAVR